MAWLGFDPKKGRIKTDAGITIDGAYLAHVNIPAPAAASETGVLALTALGTAAADVITGLGALDFPRNVQIDCNKAGITSNVTIEGVNFEGEEITETKALNGQTAVALDKAFKKINKVTLPIRTNAPAKQKATIAVTQAAQGAGNTIYTFTSAATGTAYDITVAYASTDNTTTLAAAVLKAALNADATFAAKWLAASSGANITIESLTYEAQDATINLVVKTAGTPAVNLGSITVNTVSGVAEDKVSVGWGKKFGLPYMLPADEQVILKLFNGAAEGTPGTITNSATALESNTFEPNGAPDGEKDIDLYIVV